MGLGGHGHAGVGDPGGQLAQGVPRAGAEDEQVQQLLGADGLGGLHRGDDPVVADALHLPHQVVGVAEAGVGGGGTLRDDGDHVSPPGADLFQGGHGPGVGAEGAAHGKANCLFFQKDPFLSNGGAHRPSSWSIL